MTIADRNSRTVRSRGADFSYLEAGSGPPLVLLHGIGSAAASFQYQLETLSTRFRVVAWDAPGYGASTPLATERPDTSLYATALDAYLGVPERSFFISRVCHEYDLSDSSEGEFLS